MSRTISAIAVFLFLLLPANARAAECLECHIALSADSVADWRQSRHSEAGVGCADCHGSDHSTTADSDKARMPVPATCGQCHEDRVDEYSRGKHAFAWAALQAMPTTHAMPMVLADGMKGCGGCHKIGLKDEDEILRLKEGGSGFGFASCDSCHTRRSRSPTRPP